MKNVSNDCLRLFKIALKLGCVAEQAHAHLPLGIWQWLLHSWYSVRSLTIDLWFESGQQQQFLLIVNSIEKTKIRKKSSGILKNHDLRWKSKILRTKHQIWHERPPVTAVWPDWAIFLTSRWPIFLKKLPKYYGKFLGYFKNLLFGQYWEKLGTFLFQHLVTLPVSLYIVPLLSFIEPARLSYETCAQAINQKKKVKILIFTAAAVDVVAWTLPRPVLEPRLIHFSLFLFVLSKSKSTWEGSHRCVRFGWEPQPMF